LFSDFEHMGGFTHRKKKRVIGLPQPSQTVMIEETVKTGVVVFPNVNVEEQVAFVDKGFFIAYEESNVPLAVPYTVVGAMLTISIEDASNILGISQHAMRRHVKPKAMENLTSMNSSLPSNIIAQLAVNKKWPFRRLSFNDQDSIRRFRRELIYVMTTTSWDQRLVEILIATHNRDEEVRWSNSPQFAVYIKPLNAHACVVNAGFRQDSHACVANAGFHQDSQVSAEASKKRQVDEESVYGLKLPVGFDEELDLNFFK